MKTDFEDGYTSLAFVAEVDMSECLRAAAVLSLESRYATPYLCCVEMARALVCMLFGHLRSGFFKNEVGLIANLHNSESCKLPHACL